MPQVSRFSRPGRECLVEPGSSCRALVSAAISLLIAFLVDVQTVAVPVAASVVHRAMMLCVVNAALVAGIIGLPVFTLIRCGSAHPLMLVALHAFVSLLVALLIHVQASAMPVAGAHVHLAAALRIVHAILETGLVSALIFIDLLGVRDCRTDDKGRGAQGNTKRQIPDLLQHEIVSCLLVKVNMTCKVRRRTTRKCRPALAYKREIGRQPGGNNSTICHPEPNSAGCPRSRGFRDLGG